MAPRFAVTLPAPVVRYLARALGERPVAIARASIDQQGELRTSVTASRWLQFAAQEVVRPADAAFCWDARVRVAPGVRVRVRDAYENGEGRGRVDLWSVIPVAHERGGANSSLGALLRFLAEAPWYPTVLLPSPSLTWSAIDPDRALATLSDHGRTAQATFRFDAAGDVIGVYTQVRPYRTRGGYRQLPWEGRFFDHAVRQGVRIPHGAEVGWIEEGAWQCVWRGRITAIRYELVG
jgi:hypothetical protein